MKKIHFTSLNSTNDYLKENYESLDNLTFVSSDYQTNGHGRLGRQWFSLTRENLLFSYLIKKDIKLNNPGLYSIYASVVIAKYLINIGIKNVSIKWPNDIYVNDKKICGILSIGRFQDDKLDYVIVGIGLNVNQMNIDEAIIHPFTSMRLEMAKNYQLSNIEEQLFPLLYDSVINIGKYKEEYDLFLKEYNYLKGKVVIATINNEKVYIKVIDIVNGKLLVQTNDNTLLLDSGEITFH